MEKKFNKFELARIKRIAQNVNQYVSRKNKLVAKIEEMQAEINNLQQMIDLSDAPVKLMTGGYGVEELVKKIVTPTDKLDKNGNIINITTYEFIYDTIIPPMVDVNKVDTPVNEEEWYNAESTNSTITPSTNNGVGSDYDIDDKINY